MYREFIEYFLEAGYTFVSPDDLVEGLNPDGCYVLSTFDDGYYNNSHVVPLLQEYKTPALFYISTHNVLQNECFWWDVLHRELCKQGKGRKEISAIRGEYKKLKHPQILERLRNEFGENVLAPCSDIDRPLTPEELISFAEEEYVHLGNHTSQHYALDHYPPDVQRQQIAACQEDLQRVVGIQPKTIAYPNGNYNEATLQVADELGFDYGITVEKRKNYLPLRPEDRLRLGRFTLWGGMSIRMQCDIFRSDMSAGTKR